MSLLIQSTLVLLGRAEESIDHLRKAMRLKPAWPEAHVALGNALLAQRRPGEAAGCYRKAVTLKPNWPEPANHLAWVLATSVDDGASWFGSGIWLKPLKSKFKKSPAN